MHYLTSDPPANIRNLPALLAFGKKHLLTWSLVSLVFFFTGMAVHLKYFSYYESTCVITQEGVKLSLNGKADASNDFLSIQDDGKDFKRLVQIAQSDTIAKLLNRDFKLADHYGIKPTADHVDQKLLRRLRKNLVITKNIHDQIVITFRDGKDAELASRIANRIPHYLDQINRASIRKEIATFIDAQRNAYEVAEQKNKSLQRDMIALLDESKAAPHLTTVDKDHFSFLINQSMSMLTSNLEKTFENYQRYMLALGVNQEDRLPTILFRQVAIADDTNMTSDNLIVGVFILLAACALGFLTLFWGRQLLGIE